ncbi:MAG: ATP-binding protein, partial [Prevotella sp.]|nr:ATP-binding protein [Prevotella sp.]
NQEGSSREQIDLVIDRRDQVVNLCEMKYSRASYEITRQYIERMNERLEAFRAKTSTKKALHITMITTFGIKPNVYSGMVQSEVTMDDLFIDVSQ